MRGEQAIFNLKIKKKSELSLNPDIHHSKVFSSEQMTTLPLKSLCDQCMRYPYQISLKINYFQLWFLFQKQQEFQARKPTIFYTILMR